MYRRALALADATRQNAKENTATGIGSQRNAHFNLGRVLMVQGRTAEAIREFQTGEEISAKRVAGSADPYAVVSRYLIGTALIRSGDRAGALKKADEIRDLVQRNGFNAPLQGYSDFLVAQEAEVRGDQQGLGSALDRVTAVHRRNLPIYWRLAAVRSALNGDVAAALSIYDRLRTDIEPSRFDSGDSFTFFYERSHLGCTVGRLYEQQRDVAKAREQYTRFLKLMVKADRGIPDVEDAKKRLAALGPK